MKNLNRLVLILFFLILSNNSNLKENKVIFSINEDLFTTIDFETRKNYLLLKDGKLEKEDEFLLNDFINLMIFNYYFNNNEKNKINSINEETNKYFETLMSEKKISKESFKNIKKKNIILNLKYDLIKKNILEKKLDQNKNLIFKEKEDILNIYDINIQYYIIASKEIEKIKKNETKIDFDTFKKVLKNIDVNYKFINKEILNFSGLNNKIKNIILEKFGKEKKFVITNKNHYIVGKIKKNIKKNIKAKFNLYQITSDKELEEKLIKCKKIESLKENKKIKIKTLKNMDINSLNKIIQENLIDINNFIKIKNQNEINYIILCELIFDDTESKKNNINQNVKELLYQFENKFLENYKRKYKVKIYYE